VVAVLAGCQKKEVASAPPAAPAEKTPPPPKPLAVEAVKETERSKHFTAVNKQLELGGMMYGYVDVDGDVLKLTGDAQRLLAEVAKTDPKARLLSNADLTDIARTLGVTDVKALGVSSVQDDAGYFRNRMFLYTGGERHGLLAALGGSPAPFKHVGLAPADAAFFGETEIDVGVLYRALKDVVEKVAGEPAGAQLETVLKKASDATAFSVLELIHGLKGRSALILRVDPEKTIRVPAGPQPLVVPAFSLLACVEGVGSILEGSFAKDRNLKRSDSGALHVYTPVQRIPLEGIEPAIIVDGTTLYFTTSLAFFNECRDQKTNLGQNADFQRALARVGKEGNGLTYVSPRFFARVRDLETLNPNLPAQMKSLLAFMLTNVPKTEQALVSIRTNVEDGILVRSYWTRSLKQEVAMASLYNPVTVGALAAMAIPAFQKVRTASQEKAVLNNLRMLAAAADQYYLENGVTTATYDQLVGPTRYVKVIQPVAGENYRALRFVQGEPLRVRLANGRVIEYKP
jgi:type IV pilus assembly protein PilA